MEKSDEKSLLFDKAYTCPVCDVSFKSKSVKSGAAKLIETGMDLRPIYQNVDVTKYDVVLCPECGYAALAKYFLEIHQAQRRYLEQKVAANYKKRSIDHEYYSYDVAMERYKLALLSTVVKTTDESELGYVCLKISWLLQNRRDSLEKDDPKRREYEREAHLYSQKALEHLMKARMEEDYPICGMDMATLDYLLAALAAMDSQFDLAMRMLATVSQTRDASDRLKNKAYDLKEYISEQQKEAKNKSGTE